MTDSAEFLPISFTMIVHILRHAPYIYYGHIQNWIESWGAQVIETRFYQGGGIQKDPQSDLTIIMGGPMSSSEEKNYPWLLDEKKFIERLLKKEKKVFGICLGAQLIAEVLGSKITKLPEKEIGWHQIKKVKNLAPEINKKLQKIPETFTSFQWHGDSFQIPEDAVHIFENDNLKNQGFLYKKSALGIQFHPEMDQLSIEHMIWKLGNQLTEESSKRVHSKKDILKNIEKHDEENLSITNQLIDLIIDK